MLSSSLLSGSAVSLFMAYFLGNCGSQIWSHAHFFMFGLLTLFQSLLWNCGVENSMEWQNYKMGDTHNPSASSSLFTWRILSNPWSYKHLKNEVRYLRHHLALDSSVQIWYNKPAHTSERQGVHDVLVTPHKHPQQNWWRDLSSAVILCEGKARDEKVAP